MADKKNPEIIEDSELEVTSGGLVPAVQKVRDAASRPSSSNTYQGTTTVNQGILNATSPKPQG